jgi:hypothetical protein
VVDVLFMSSVAGTAILGALAVYLGAPRERSGEAERRQGDGEAGPAATRSVDGAGSGSREGSETETETEADPP